MVAIILLVTLPEGRNGSLLSLKGLVLRTLEMVHLLLAFAPIVVNAGLLSSPNHIILFLCCHNRLYNIVLEG